MRLTPCPLRPAVAAEQDSGSVPPPPRPGPAPGAGGDPRWQGGREWRRSVGPKPFWGFGEWERGVVGWQLGRGTEKSLVKRSKERGILQRREL